MLLKVDVCEHFKVVYDGGVGGPVLRSTWHQETKGNERVCDYCDHICTVAVGGICETCEHWRRHAPDYAVGTCLRTMHNALAGDYCYRHREASDGEAAGSD